jgi:hypothetical protein
MGCIQWSTIDFAIGQMYLYDKINCCFILYVELLVAAS